jgi:hypothetical protein
LIEIKKTENLSASFFYFYTMELPALPFRPQAVFITPLNWGLGHATRMADLVVRFQHFYPDTRIILGSDGVAYTWLQQQFPALPVVKLPGYHIRYSKGSSLVLPMALSAPRMVAGILMEHFALRRIIRAYGIDLIISDNRYGIRSRSCFSVFVTHQLALQPPNDRYGRLFRWVNRLQRYWINGFDRCWIPDLADGIGLAGALSHPEKPPANAAFIGPLSRFRHLKHVPPPDNPPALLCLVSGPEPQRTQLLEKILEQLETIPLHTVIVAGTPGNRMSASALPHVKIYPHLTDHMLMPLIQSAQWIISRPGYSTLMDLHVTGCKKRLFVPTPGQTEQEYLATIHGKTDGVVIQKQQELDLTVCG